MQCQSRCFYKDFTQERTHCRRLKILWERSISLTKVDCHVFTKPVLEAVVALLFSAFSHVPKRPAGCVPSDESGIERCWFSTGNRRKSKESLGHVVHGNKPV